MLRWSNMRCAQLNKLVFSVFPLFSSSIDIVWISRENLLLSTEFCEQAALPMTANEVWRQRTRLESPFEKYYIPLGAANNVLTMSTAVRFFFFWNSRNEIHAVFNDHRKRSLCRRQQCAAVYTTWCLFPEKSVIGRVHLDARRFR